MPRIVACYREFLPCEALRPYVRTFFTFGVPENNTLAHRPIIRELLMGEQDSFCSPMFADGQISIVLNFKRVCRTGGPWHIGSERPNGMVLGALTNVGPDQDDERPEMAGVYLQPAGASVFTHVPACLLTDRIVPLEDLWGAAERELLRRLEASNEATRIDQFESALLKQIRRRSLSNDALDVPGLAMWILRRQGRLSVQRLADAAGVSRQHLTRAFREQIGVTPKLYCRLARFQSGLSYAGRGNGVDWAQAALEMGYADQSHMIAEFKRFSSLTPQKLAAQEWFHPFIERAKDARRRSYSCL
jgi:AraC-like DNA-binding protein